MSENTITKGELLKRAWATWQETRGHTLALLDHLSDKQLVIPFPRPVFNNFGRQFQELGVIQAAYIIAIESSHMDYSKMSFEFDQSLVSSKERLREFLTQQDAALEDALAKQDPYQIIDWQLPENPTLLEHIYWLSQHETLHHGQLIAYCFLLNITIPKPLAKAWAFPANDPELVYKWLENWHEYVARD